MQIDFGKNSTQAWLALITSSIGLLIALSWLANCLSFNKPARLIPATGAGLFALAGAIAASRGIKPAEKWRVDEIADLTLFEIERENAMEELDEEDNARRELDRYERKVRIETDALQRTLPLQLQLQQMRSILYPVQMPPSVVQHPGFPAPMPPIDPNNPTTPVPTEFIPPQTASSISVNFDFDRLKNIDEFPVIAVIGGMGAGKSKLLKWLAKYVFLSKEIRACDSFGRKSEWKTATVYPKPQNIYEMMESDLTAIENESEEYRDGKSNFPERLTILEESPDTLSELRRYQQLAQQSIPKAQRRDVVGDWLLKSLTYNRKLRRRAAFVSVSMSATEFIPAEHRNKAVVLFPGTAISEAMNDIHYFKLGTAQNQKLREQLSAHVATLKNPCLIYCKGQWFAGSLPDLDLEGNVVGPSPESDIDRLDRLFDQDFPEGEHDR